MRRGAFILFVVLAGCGGPPVGDALEAAGSRSASELPQNEAQKALAGIRPHGLAKGLR